MRNRLALLIIAGIPAPLAAQDADAIIITAPPAENRVTSPVLSIDGKAIDEQAPVAMAELFRTVPGVQMRVNSRGETVVRLRGSEERQTGIFLDGAPLAVPWDGRVDLGLIPAGLINRISVIKGAAPLEYGPNLVAGVIDLQTGIARKETTGRAEAQAGTYGLFGASAVASTPLMEGLSLVVGVSHFKRDAERIADRSAVPFDPAVDRRRANTDVNSDSLFVAVAYDDEGGSAFRLSWLHGDIEKGIAAQGDLDPATSNPRFWRYPRWNLDQLTVVGNVPMSHNVMLHFTGWQQWFGQTIHNFASSSYTLLRARERGKDSSQGIRATLASKWQATSLRMSTTAQRSTHWQQEGTTPTGLEQSFVDGPRLRYRQDLYSIGAELDRRLFPKVAVTLGVGRDWSRYPLTGDKPDQPDLAASSAYAAARWNPTDAISISSSIGRRTRFPAMRELFGEALGRFLVNPDLGPERSWLGDVALRWSASSRFTLDGDFWIADNDGTLSQRIIRVGRVNRRQRYNTAGNVSYGLEANATFHVTPELSAELGAAFQWGNAKEETDGSRPVLLQRPNSQLSAAADWRPLPQLDLRAEIQRTGSARDLADDGGIKKLPSHSSVNLRAFWEAFKVGDGLPVSLFAAADNVTDSLILPQLGLPASGRTIRLGVRVGARP